MRTKLDLSADDAGERGVQAVISRLFFAISIAGAVVVALLVFYQYPGYRPQWQKAMAGLPFAVAAAVAVGIGLAQRGRQSLGVALVLVTGYLSIVAIPVASGLGLRSMMLAFCSPLIIVAGVMLGIAGALAFGLLAAAALLSMAVWPPGDGAGDALTTTVQLLLVSGAVVVFSTLVGILIALALVNSLRAAKQQEHRFRRLLAIAADWYWEQQAHWRLTEISDAARALQTPQAEAVVRRQLFDEAPPDLPAARWAAHQEDVRKRQPFLDHVVHLPGGEAIGISGEPLFDDLGEFRGFWGIGRIVTGEVESHRRLEASEALYREFFERASTGFILHHAGHVVRANQAAAVMFGYAAPRDMEGASLLDHVDPSHRELSRQRFAQLDAGGIGQKVPPVDLPMLRRDGTCVDVLASMVRLAMLDGPATLSVVVDMTQRKEVERLLSAARDQAQVASHAKSRFLANMSHEIRTPLNGVYGLAQLALRENLSAARRQDYLRQIVDSAEHLSRLVSDVLDLSKIEAGELRLERVVFDLHALLESVAQGFHRPAADKGLPMTLEIEPAVPQWVRGDPTRVRQVVGNFLGNALKFTAAGRIGLDVRTRAPGCVRLTVSDTGIGIEPEAQARLFRPFAQADESTTRRFGGTGLGLSICRELASMMGGSVGLDSTPGVGTTVWAELPLPEAIPAAPVNAREISLAGVRVLVVDDDPVNITIAEAMLAGAAALVTLAENGIVALERLDAAPDRFDAVLMDLQMPQMGGIEAATAIRQYASADKLPIIAMTAAVLEQDREAALRAGMNDFVSKPFALDQLLATVARWTAWRR